MASYLHGKLSLLTKTYPHPLPGVFCAEYLVFLVCGVLHQDLPYCSILSSILHMVPQSSLTPPPCLFYDSWISALA